MKLNAWAFEQISNGSKTFEIRLYDEKRRDMEVGDKIVFSEFSSLENKVEVNVLNLIIADNFENLFTKFNPVLAGWKVDDSPRKCANDMSKYYSNKVQEEYGVVAIEVELDK